MSKKHTIIDKSEIMECWKCNGSGYTHNECYGEGDFCYAHDEKNCKGEICQLCNGSGKFRESHYIIVDEKNKIAIDSDCGA